MNNFKKLLPIVFILALLVGCMSTEEDQSTTSAFLETLEKTIVTRVVDGDTIVIESGEKVRFILVNTPESVHPNKEKNSEFGKLASEYTTNQLLDQIIYLEIDVSNTDRYGRLLRYIYLEDGTFFNEQLVKEGYAQLATYPPDIKYLDRIQAAETFARENSLGLWGYSDKSENTEVQKISSEDGNFVGSINSNKYHKLDCGHVHSIAEKNKVFFLSIEEANKKDYIPCKACNPAD